MHDILRSVVVSYSDAFIGFAGQYLMGLDTRLSVGIGSVRKGAWPAVDCMFQHGLGGAALTTHFVSRCAVQLADQRNGTFRRRMEDRQTLVLKHEVATPKGKRLMHVQREETVNARRPMVAHLPPGDRIAPGPRDARPAFMRGSRRPTIAIPAAMIVVAGSMSPPCWPCKVAAHDYSRGGRQRACRSIGANLLPCHDAGAGRPGSFTPDARALPFPVGTVSGAYNPAGISPAACITMAGKFPMAAPRQTKR